jgi:hypothetical protein
LSIWDNFLPIGLHEKKGCRRHFIGNIRYDISWTAIADFLHSNITPVGARVERGYKYTALLAFVHRSEQWFLSLSLPYDQEENQSNELTNLYKK